MLMSIHCSRRYCHKFKTGTDHFLLIMSSPLRCKLNKSGHNHSCNRFILLIVILCNPAVNPNQANCQHLQRRNLKWLTATITALTYCSSPYVAPPFCRPTYTAVNLKGGAWSDTLPPRRFAILRIAQSFPKAEFEAAHCRCQRRLTAAAALCAVENAICKL